MSTIVSFTAGFVKAASNKEVSTVACFHKGSLLWGRRRESMKWTTPGGHLEEGEDALEGAKRELMEEAGVEGTNWKHIQTKKVTTPKGEKLTVHGFSCDVKDTQTSMKNDPDQEVYRWHWVKGLPKGDLHVPLKNNVLVDCFTKSASRIARAKKALSGYQPNWLVEYTKSFHDRHIGEDKK